MSDSTTSYKGKLHSKSQCLTILYSGSLNQARDIYLCSVSCGMSLIDENELDQRLENLKNLLFELDPTMRGELSLGWPYIVAAAEK